MNGFETSAQTWLRMLGWGGATVGVFGLLGFLTGGNLAAMVVLFLVVVVPLALIGLLAVAVVRAGSKPKPVMVHRIPQSMPVRQGPPPGWYRDNTGTERWWDGTTFTQFSR
ncbi:DUF2510 domain-containing protein [Nocardia terpenica]|uniref:DUF2510 domain-containing protein n=1 Tax=Nocardia terpenica TaxID=455432 RepID=UPI0018934F6C|nr:DUF2510 domain-containing protein [Nocardia terpenica]MBF6063004.1 DUF2510 domain-containing protein [Nocardia terpenica]MBF6104861.1 DUF2510 domain-containing protein [Nocardia terpenica]MBF6112702.1 DUF2510 domain-containing protein [Nocardia terpenica]MBF6118589.1 DUF2510 domain-containing protein [Nocardia terpenica]MBF6155068.1 DUF2510 domain-containing protein [Nocardia terpenica]